MKHLLVRVPVQAGPSPGGGVDEEQADAGAVLAADELAGGGSTSACASGVADLEGGEQRRRAIRPMLTSETAP